LKVRSKVEENRLESIRNVKREKKEEEYTDRMEDYLEVIYELMQQKGYATAVDISKYLNVSSPSVTKMIQRLNENGHLNYEKYRGISLTRQGVSIAKNIHNRHGLLTDLHPETLKKLEEFVKLIKMNPKLIDEPI